VVLAVDGSKVYHFMYTLNRPAFCHGRMPVPGLFCGEGSIGTDCGNILSGIDK
jgi:hypothetical protein